MLRTIRGLLYPMLLFTRWNVGTRGTEFVWKRYNRETDTWEIKEMTPDGQEDAYWWWAIK